ncbi:MAG: ParA family protein [Nitrospirales bacterium]|nr:ParA family protein [Nitrospirales bacterium]
MGKTIVIVNQKGGVGKTTTAINLSASIALAEKDILVIDTDPQGNLTSGLGIDKESVGRGLYDVYAGRASLEEVIVETAIPHLHVVPSTVDLLGVELELVQKDERERLLLTALSAIKERYRYIFIDCPPSLGLLTLNGMVAADSVIVPVQCEYYSLEGLSLLSRTLRLVRNAFNASLDIEGIILTMHDSRNTLSRQVEAEVRNHFQEKVYQTMIPRNVTLGEAPSHGKPAILYDARSKGAQSYLSLAKEILNEDSIRQRS